MDIGIKRCSSWQRFSMQHTYEVNKNGHCIYNLFDFYNHVASIYLKVPITYILLIVNFDPSYIHYNMVYTHQQSRSIMLRNNFV